MDANPTHSRTLLVGVERDFKLWKGIMYATLSLGVVNIVAIFLFEEFISSNAAFFQGLTEVPAIKYAIQLLNDLQLEDDTFVENRSKKILGIYGITLLSGLLLGGGILFLGAGCFLCHLFSYMQPNDKNITSQTDLNKALKLCISAGILALGAAIFLFSLEVYWGNYGPNFYHNHVFSRDIDFYRYPLFMWLSISVLWIAIFFIFLSALILKTGGKNVLYKR